MGPAVREYPVGEGMLAETEILKVDPDTVKQVDPGVCVVVAGGRAQHVLVSPVRLRTPDACSPTIASSDRLDTEEIDRGAWRTWIPQPKPIPEPIQDAANDSDKTTHGAEPAAGQSIREY